MRYFLSFAAIFLALAGTANAKERRLSIQGFESIQVFGNVSVDIETGKGPSAIAEAETLRVLDRISLRKAGNELIVSMRDRNDQTNRFSSDPPIKLRLTTNRLNKILHRGSGKLSVDNMDGRNTSVRIGGFGSVTIANIESDRLDVSMNGGGELIAGGEARKARITLLGSSRIDASGLLVEDLNLVQRGPANAQISVENRAEISNQGTGFIEIGGRPDCQVRSVGSAEIICNPKS